MEALSAMPQAVTEDREAESRLRAHVETLEWRLRKRDEQRRAMLHIMGDLNEVNRRLGDQRKAAGFVLRSSSSAQGQHP